jgi:Flp pilus assembly pilin Flp
LAVDSRGVSSVEYALLLAFVAGGIILAASQLGTAVETEMNDTANCIENAGTC